MKKHGLLERAIKVRNLHHIRFYSLNMDYGHKAYLDKLQAELIAVHLAQEALCKRQAEVKNASEKGFRWVRNTQEVEESNTQEVEESRREKESQRVKREHQLSKRQMKVVEARLKAEKKRE